MTDFEIISSRHTVRNYEKKALSGALLDELQAMISTINSEHNLHLQLVNGAEEGLTPYGIRYGKWSACNYISMIGPKSETLEETVGYYGEQIVLWAQEHGLKTGWLETTYEQKPDAIDVREGETLVLTLAIGYSEQTGSAHKVKSIEQLSTVKGEMPEWFRRGMEYAQLAPTAGNQQLFNIAWDGKLLSITTQPGFMEQVDLGIAKLHFELGAGFGESMERLPWS